MPLLERPQPVGHLAGVDPYHSDIFPWVFPSDGIRGPQCVDMQLKDSDIFGLITLARGPGEYPNRTYTIVFHPKDERRPFPRITMRPEDTAENLCRVDMLPRPVANMLVDKLKKGEEVVEDVCGQPIQGQAVRDGLFRLLRDEGYAFAKTWNEREAQRRS